MLEKRIDDAKSFGTRYLEIKVNQNLMFTSRMSVNLRIMYLIHLENNVLYEDSSQVIFVFYIYPSKVNIFG